MRPEQGKITSTMRETEKRRMGYLGFSLATSWQRSTKHTSKAKPGACVNRRLELQYGLRNPLQVRQTPAEVLDMGVKFMTQDICISGFIGTVTRKAKQPTRNLLR